MYHRIAAPAFDPWGLAVSPAMFEDQLAMLRRYRSPMGMGEFAERLALGRLPADAAAVTFDDGYLDNLELGQPRLAAAAVPATVFVVTGNVGCPDGFWWDELARIVLGSSLAADLELEFGAQRVSVRFTGAPEEAPRPAWRAWSPPATARETAYLDLWRRFYACGPQQRRAAFARLRALPGAPAGDGSRAMDEGELRALASSSIAVGAHSVSHRPLPSLAPEARAAEIRESGDICRSLTGQPVEGFAYPHGATDAATGRMVAQAGFRWACSTESRSVRPDDDPYHLPRLQVGDWDGRQLRAALGALA